MAHEGRIDSITTLEHVTVCMLPTRNFFFGGFFFFSGGGVLADWWVSKFSQGYVETVGLELSQEQTNHTGPCRGRALISAGMHISVT